MIHSIHSHENSRYTHKREIGTNQQKCGVAPPLFAFARLKLETCLIEESVDDAAPLEFFPVEIKPAGMDSLSKEQKIEEIRWRSNWHFIIAKMLENKPILFKDNVYLKNTSGKKGAAP